LTENKSLRIEISGHTDNVGEHDYNMDLSQERAKAVGNVLMKKGIDPKRLEMVGYGETQPLASNDDEKDGRELNRRIEIKVLETVNTQYSKSL
jgi:outer membrane protein OmpA-like peptidoglycan-associated protein